MNGWMLLGLSVIWSDLYLKVYCSERERDKENCHLQQHDGPCRHYAEVSQTKKDKHCTISLTCGI